MAPAFDQNVVNKSIDQTQLPRSKSVQFDFLYNDLPIKMNKYFRYNLDKM